MAKAKKKKKFFEVEMQGINKEAHLLAYNIKDLNERIITYDLTKLLRGKSILAQFKVHVEEEKAHTRIKKIKVMPYFLRRMMRKGTDYVEDSFSADAKDAKVKIKPFLITRRRVSRRVKKGLREKAHEELTKYLKSKKVERIFDDILKNKLQKDLSLKLKKVYPLSLCEIRMFEVENYTEPLNTKEDSNSLEQEVPEEPEKPEENKNSKKE